MSLCLILSGNFEDRCWCGGLLSVFFFSLKGQTFLYVVSLAQGKVLL